MITTARSGSYRPFENKLGSINDSSEEFERKEVRRNLKLLIYSKERRKESGVKTILIENRVLFYIAAATTMIAGGLHLAMVGPSLIPINFPMELLPYTDGLFLISGIAQIFWAVPMALRWNTCWFYAGLIGTIALTSRPRRGGIVRYRQGPFPPVENVLRTRPIRAYSNESFLLLITSVKKAKFVLNLFLVI